MIKAIIFDCFGVLVTDGWHPFKNKYFDKEPDKNAEATKLNNMTNQGLITYQVFLQGVSELAGITANEVVQEISHNAPNLDLFDYIREVQLQFKIGILSNAAENWLDELFTPEQLKLIDATVLSCDISANKPDAEAYKAIASKIGCNISECLFVDDIYSYVEGAKKVGMQAIHYKDSDQAIAEIKALVAYMNN